MADAGVGGYVLKDEPIEINEGRPRTKMKVRNTGDRPIQVGSHFHFFEANRALAFDRPKTFGLRLDIPAGTAVRFEPGDELDVTLVPYGGKRRVHGFNGLVDGWADASAAYAPNQPNAVRKAQELGFKSMSKSTSKPTYKSTAKSASKSTAKSASKSKSTSKSK